jgi:hypothetical protein
VFVTERVGERFHRVARVDREASQVQRSMDLRERERVARLDEHGARRVAELAGAHRTRVGRLRWDGRWPAGPGGAVPPNEVRIEARPHEDTRVRELGPDLAEAVREAELVGADPGGLGEQAPPPLLERCARRGVERDEWRVRARDARDAVHRLSEGGVVR